MDSAQIKAMVDNNAVSIDLANTDATDAAILARAGLLERIDYDIVDRKPLLPEAAQEFYLLPDFAAYVMAWNTKSHTATELGGVLRCQGEAGPALSLEGRAANARGRSDGWRSATPQALSARSRPRLCEAQCDQEFSLMVESGAQGAQLIIGGEVDIGTVWKGRLFKPKAEGAPVDFTFDGALVVADAMVVPKGAKNKNTQCSS
jgi:putative spermidine/putrescine transport system substrate-binding protein